MKKVRFLSIATIILLISGCGSGGANSFVGSWMCDGNASQNLVIRHDSGNNYILDLGDNALLNLTYEDGKMIHPKDKFDAFTLTIDKKSGNIIGFYFCSSLNRIK